jgi:hypothetical protein
MPIDKAAVKKKWDDASDEEKNEFLEALESIGVKVEKKGKKRSSISMDDILETVQGLVDDVAELKKGSGSKGKSLMEQIFGGK